MTKEEFKEKLNQNVKNNVKNKESRKTMRNRLSDLNNYLFEELERLNDDEELQDETKLKRELDRSKAITNVSQQIISNANVVLKAKIHCDQFGDNLEEFLQLGLTSEKVD